MNPEKDRIPKVILPFIGPAEPGFQDIFVYLRPESNGIEVESAVFRALRKPEFSKQIQLAYLANLPGDFIAREKIIEHHYSTRLHFAAAGKSAFTSAMKSQFERFFSTPFETAKIIGSFEAIHILKLLPEELFNIWVPVYDILELNGQLIKKVPTGEFVVNYDIPALLHKNNTHTDIAVMILRTNLDYGRFKVVLDDIKSHLIEAQILNYFRPERRVFHFSKSPFEQILDASGYFFSQDLTRPPLLTAPFFSFLVNNSISESEILDAIHHPIRQFKKPDGSVEENNLFVLTLFCSYEKALELFRSQLKEGNPGWKKPI